MKTISVNPKLTVSNGNVEIENVPSALYGVTTASGSIEQALKNQFLPCGDGCDYELTAKQLLRIFAYYLKEKGYTIITRDDEDTTWFHVFKDGKMASVQKASFGGFDFGSDHVPCKEYGSGLGVVQMGNLTEQNVIDALNAKGWHNVSVKHWTSPEEYIAKQTWTKYYIL